MLFIYQRPGFPEFEAVLCGEHPLADQAPPLARTLLRPPQDGAGPVTAALLGTHESVCGLLCHNILLLINGFAFVPGTHL